MSNMEEDVKQIPSPSYVVDRNFQQALKVAAQGVERYDRVYSAWCEDLREWVLELMSEATTAVLPPVYLAFPFPEQFKRELESNGWCVTFDSFITDGSSMQEVDLYLQSESFCFSGKDREPLFVSVARIFAKASPM